MISAIECIYLCEVNGEKKYSGLVFAWVAKIGGAFYSCIKHERLVRLWLLQWLVMRTEL